MTAPSESKVALCPGLPVLVTGGGGFIGSHLVDALLTQSARVRVLDDFSTGRRENLAHCLDRIELIEDDIRDLAVCRKACKGVETVFHQAALGSVPRSLEDPAATIAVNVGGSTNIFTAARDNGVRRVVYASSSSVYGDSQLLPKREGQEGQPWSPYAASKRMTEDIAVVFSRCFDLELIGLRYFNVYGPRQRPDGPYAAVIPRFFSSLLDRQPVTIYGDGEQSRDFTYVDNAVRANLLAMDGDTEPGSVFNVGIGERITINELYAAVAEHLDSDLEPDYAAERAGDVKHSQASLDRIRAALGYEPVVGWREGLGVTLDWYRAHGWV